VAGCAAAIAFIAAGSAKAEPRTHDGFYLQLDVGLGFLSTTQKVEDVEGESLSGLSIPSGVLLGGTVGPVVIGGGLFADYVPSPSYELAGQSVELDDVSLTLYSVGLFADYYVDPHGGLHIQPFLGFGALEACANNNCGGSDPTGPVFALGVGYDFWVADEWSIGVMGRFAYAPLKVEQANYNTIAPALLATFTYH